MEQELRQGKDSDAASAKPEPVKQAALPAQLQALYEKAVDSMKKGNLDYALEMLLNVVYLAPENREIRKNLRRTQIELYGRTGKKMQAIVLACAKSVGDYALLGIAVLRKDSFKCADQCEKILARWPENRLVLKLLADNLIVCGFRESALDVLEFLRSLDPMNMYVLKNLINLYDVYDNVERAIGCCEAVLRVTPQDNDVQRQYKNLVARRTLKAGNWENTETFRDKIKDSDAAKTLEKEEQLKSASGDDIVVLYEKQLEANSQDMSVMRKLADQYLRQEDFEKAEELYGRILALRADDPYVKRMLASCGTKKVVKEIGAMRRALKDNPSDKELREKLAALEHKKTEIELDEYKALVAQNPTDMNIKYKYGCLLESVGRIDEAIGMFQKSISTPDLMIDSSIKLAGCFTLNEMFDLALEFYEKALSRMQGLDENDDRKKYIYFQQGQIYDYLGKKKQSLDKFRQIYAVDIDYKDVRDRISALRKEIGED